MKRSEMLNLISERLRLELKHNGVPSPHFENILMEGPLNILLEIERAGMLPPHCEIAERKLREKYRGIAGYYSDGNNWEPE